MSAALAIPRELACDRCGAVVFAVLNPNLGRTMLLDRAKTRGAAYRIWRMPDGTFEAEHVCCSSERSKRLLEAGELDAYAEHWHTCPRRYKYGPKRHRRAR